jgi:hypothetical protein
LLIKIWFVYWHLDIFLIGWLINRRLAVLIGWPINHRLAVLIGWPINHRLNRRLAVLIGLHRAI